MTDEFLIFEEKVKALIHQLVDKSEYELATNITAQLNFLVNTRAKMAEPQGELVQIDNQIDELEKQIIALREQRRKLFDGISQNQTAIERTIEFLTKQIGNHEEAKSEDKKKSTNGAPKVQTIQVHPRIAEIFNVNYPVPDRISFDKLTGPSFRGSLTWKPDSKPVRYLKILWAVHRGKSSPPDLKQYNKFTEGYGIPTRQITVTRGDLWTRLQNCFGNFLGIQEGQIIDVNNPALAWFLNGIAAGERIYWQNVVNLFAGQPFAIESLMPNREPTPILGSPLNFYPSRIDVEVLARLSSEELVRPISLQDFGKYIDELASEPGAAERSLTRWFNFTTELYKYLQNKEQVHWAQMPDLNTLAVQNWLNSPLCLGMIEEVWPLYFCIVGRVADHDFPAAFDPTKPKPMHQASFWPSVSGGDYKADHDRCHQ